MNTSATIVTTSHETLIFRDGKPFGLEGTLTGGRIPWPMPSTIAGMIRSRIGNSRSTDAEDYFARSDRDLAIIAKRRANIEALLKVSLRSLPVHRRLGQTRWELLFPAPADAAIFSAGYRGRELNVRPFTCQPLSAENEGCAGLWSNWLLPVPPSLAKPATENRPTFWHAEQFCRWLKEEFSEDETFANPEHLGIARADHDTRIHTAISPESGTVVEGALFDSPGIRLAVPPAKNGDRPVELGLAVFLDNLEKNDDVTGAVYFGGERRVAYNNSETMSFPAGDDVKQACGDQRFLRLVLTSPGSFANGWAPRWLLPDAEPRASSIGGADPRWVQIRGTTHQVRLRSAFVPGWVPLSGWDYDKHSPKPMRKLVPAGSVYVIEVKQPSSSAAIADKLWGRSLCDDPQDDLDGFGTAVVGCANRLCLATR